jgi:hypothetical protein
MFGSLFNSIKQIQTEHPSISLVNVCEFIISIIIFNNTSLGAKHHR